MRHQDGLKALLSHQETQFKNPEDTRSYRFEEFKPAEFRISILPLEELNESINSNKNRLLKCYKNLQKVREISDEVIQDSIFLLENTVPHDDFFNRKSSGFIIPNIAEKPKPTAKNPRAFKGTKRKLPKSASIESQNIYQAFCNATDYRSFINRYLISNPEPYFSKHFQNFKEQEKQKIHIDFFKFIMPFMSDQNWSDIIKLQVNSQQAGIYQNNDALPSICFLLNKTDQAYRLYWLEFIFKTPSDIHLPLLSIFSNSNSLNKLPSDELLDGVLQIYSQSDIKQVPYWLYIFIDAFMNGFPLSYLLTGFKLSDKYNHYLALPEKITYSAVNDEVIENCLEKLPKDWKRGLWAMNLWKSGSQNENFGEFLDTLLRRKISKTIFSEIIYIASFIGSHDDSQNVASAKWDIFRNRLDNLIRQLETLSPEYVSKFGNIFDELLEGIDGIDKIKRFDSYIQATLLFCMSGSQRESSLDACISNLISFEIDILSFPHQTIKCLDKECKSENNARLVAWGLHSMLKNQKDLTAYGLFECPQTLVNVCKVVGPIKYAERDRILNEFNKDKIKAIKTNEHSPQQLRTILQKTGILETFNPFPKKFSQWLNKEIDLSEKQVQRAWEMTVERMPEFHLHYLKTFVLNQINQSIDLPIKNKDEIFALQILNDMSTNKRGLKSFLKAYARGDRNFLINHERSKQWLRKNHTIDPAIWTQGITKSGPLKGEPIILSLEKEPLEVLKMGTYVGSCFGLGGAWSESAAAVLLDINKQVIYARNKNGKVIARQLVAISKTGKFVPYSVYPQNASNEIKALFLEYDEEFTCKLGLDLVDPDSAIEGETEVEIILSQDWWDDGPWDLKAKKDIP